MASTRAEGAPPIGLALSQPGGLSLPEATVQTLLDTSRTLRGRLTRAAVSILAMKEAALAEAGRRAGPQEQQEQQDQLAGLGRSAGSAVEDPLVGVLSAGRTGATAAGMAAWTPMQVGYHGVQRPAAGERRGGECEAAFPASHLPPAGARRIAYLRTRTGFLHGRNNERDGIRRPPREIGFRKLQELATENGITIMEKLADRSTLALFEQLTCEKQLKEDWIRLVVTILAKVCQVEYKPIIVPLFSTICQKQFIDQLVLHICRLSFDTNNNRKETVGDFYGQLCILCSAMLELTPTLACDNLDIVLKRASQELEEIPHFECYEEIEEKLKFMRKKLKNEKERLESLKAAGPKPVNHFAMKPLTDFRELSHCPTMEDIVVDNYRKPYVRPNKIDLEKHGPYENVNDYLDVQFRLMREDFIRPLRDGILDYRKSLEERKQATGKKAPRIQNIRIYEKVEILHLKTEDERVGIVLSFDPEKKFAPNIKWEYSKRLMTGSLLVLSVDEQFSSVVLVTVTKRDQKELLEGRIVVELCEGVATKDLLKRQYLMVESQVFFGAYSHVLKALKDFDEDSFPLAEYIVYGSMHQQLPDYLHRARGLMHFELLLKSDTPSSFGQSVPVDVRNTATWPSAGRLGLDDSQYRALCGALTQKLMLIQGPPGTGKTFIGLKIAANLIKNQEMWRPAEDPRPMLIVCYTNHALDQFLVGLKAATDSIVRVGGGCKSTEMEQHCINFLRRNGRRPASLAQSFKNIRQQRARFYEIKNLGDRVRSCRSVLREDAVGVVSVATLSSYGVLSEEYGFLTDSELFVWLCGSGPPALQNPFSEDIVSTGDPAFNHLDFSPANVANVTVSFSFRRFEEALPELQASGTPPNRELMTALENLKRELASTEYPRYNEQQRPPRPAAIWRLPFNERWKLYRYWRDSLLTILDAFCEPLLEEIELKLAEAANVLATWRMVEDQHIMAEYAIIGMTTSFAASRQQILKELKPRIVIVEEAAEVFESHVLVSLAGDVEHLIMIGDHQQLRPNPSVHELGVKYGLNVSLFERLIKNGVHYVTLSTQHRMRPEVAKLISPAIYPELINHPSVAEFPAVLGVAKNVFFVNHTHPEEVVKDAQSYQNSHEAQFLSCLVKYLLLQGYDPSRITVLSTYKGQQYFFSKLKQHQTHLQQVRITVVDNYQGEECDLILLSLVRSNAEDAVGFLKTENRVCVALSRARHGMFIIGNLANMTATDTVWRKVEEELRRQDAVGAALPLHCDRHGVLTPVSKAEDFSGCPQGGCLQLCKTLMPCGHDCKQVCHIQDMEHKTARCMERCTRPACPLQHPCPQLCYVRPCPPCEVPKKADLPCGHSATMPCHVDPVNYKCKTVVRCKLPACGHERDAQCHQLTRLDKLPCKVPCTLRMLCGHTCRSNCHVLNDPKHEQVKCMQPCGQKRHGCSAEPEHACRLVCHQPCEDCTVVVDKTLPCGHAHKMPCNGDPAEVQCGRNCTRTLPACGHKCSRKCSEPCEPCTVEVPKVLPGCGHTQTMNCGRSSRVFVCKEPCARRLPCGHRCTLQCGQPCAGCKCSELVPYPGTPACGHSISVPCHQKNLYAFSSRELLALCSHPCPALLKPCEHRCGGSCGSCLQGRLHQPCRSKCDRPLFCGHLCKEACPKICPPCTQPCAQKCIHSSCNHRCGEPCARCKEPCPRRCEHGKCPRRCGDKCSFECHEPCGKKVQACGHDCIGLCGDACICRECNEEEVGTIFFGTEEDEGARFVKLPDCKHIFESSSLNDWMSADNAENDKPVEIKPKECPRCKTPVTSSQRYSDVMKKVSLDMEAVKAQFYDTKKIQAHLQRTMETLQDIPRFPPEFAAASRLLLKAVRFREDVQKRMPRGKESGTRRTPPLNTSEAKNLEQNVRILKSLGQIVNQAVEADNMNASGMLEMQHAVDLLCGSLQSRHLARLSEQEAADINLELERLQRLVQLLQIESGSSFRQLKEADKKTHADISKIVRGLSRYPQGEDGRIREQLEALAAASSAHITRQELDAIVAAMDMKPGHWFRCPNGHPYCIGECGGAMEEASCPVEGCGARIGGGSHRLRDDNTLATDIDGARMPAFNEGVPIPAHLLRFE